MNIKRTYVGRAIKVEMGRSKCNQKELASKCDMSQASLCVILRDDIRLAPTTLSAITHCWPNEMTNKRILVAHLRDEIRRAGHDPEEAVKMTLADGTQPETADGLALETLRRHMSDPDVAALVHNFAELLRRSDKVKKIEPCVHCCIDKAAKDTAEGSVSGSAAPPS